MDPLSEEEVNTAQQVDDDTPSRADVPSKLSENESEEPESATNPDDVAQTGLENRPFDGFSLTQAIRNLRGLEQAESTRDSFKFGEAAGPPKDDKNRTIFKAGTNVWRNESVDVQIGADTGSKTEEATVPLLAAQSPTSPGSNLLSRNEGKEDGAVSPSETTTSYAAILARRSPVESTGEGDPPSSVPEDGVAEVALQSSDLPASRDSEVSATAASAIKEIVEEHDAPTSTAETQLATPVNVARTPIDEQGSPLSASVSSTTTQFKVESAVDNLVPSPSRHSHFLSDRVEDKESQESSPTVEPRGRQRAKDNRLFGKLKPLQVPVIPQTKDADEPRLSAADDQSESKSSLTPYDLRVLDLDNLIRSYQDSVDVKTESRGLVEDMVKAVRAIANTFEESAAGSLSDAIRRNGACLPTCPFNQLSLKLLADVRRLLSHFEQVSELMLAETCQERESRSPSRTRGTRRLRSPEPNANREMAPEEDEFIARFRGTQRFQAPPVTLRNRFSSSSAFSLEQSEDSSVPKEKEAERLTEASSDQGSRAQSRRWRSTSPDGRSQEPQNVNLEQELSKAGDEDHDISDAEDGWARDARDVTDGAPKDDTKCQTRDSKENTPKDDAKSAHRYFARDDIKMDGNTKVPKLPGESRKNRNWGSGKWHEQQPAWDNPSWTAETVLDEHVDFELPESDNNSPQPRASTRAGDKTHIRSKSSRFSTSSPMNELALMGEEVWPFVEKHDGTPDASSSWYNMDESTFPKTRKGVVWQVQRADSPEARNPSWKNRESHPLDKNGYLYDEQEDAWFREDKHGWFEVRKAPEDVDTPGRREEKKRKQRESEAVDLAWFADLWRHVSTPFRFPWILFGYMHQSINKSTLLQAGIRALRLAMLLLTIQMYVANKRERSTWLEANGLTRVHMLQLMHREPLLLTTGVDYSHALGWMDVTTATLYLLHICNSCIGVSLQAVSKMSAAAASWRSFVEAACSSALTEAVCFSLAIFWRALSYWVKDALTLPLQFFDFFNRTNQATIDHLYELGTSLVGLLFVAWSYSRDWWGWAWLLLDNVDVNGWWEFLYSGGWWP